MMMLLAFNDPDDWCKAVDGMLAKGRLPPGLVARLAVRRRNLGVPGMLVGTKVFCSFSGVVTGRDYGLVMLEVTFGPVMEGTEDDVQQAVQVSAVVEQVTKKLEEAKFEIANGLLTLRDT